ncbi:MAG TPA: YHS domain-containing (seleno)protein [Chryseosolibacter sp.]
MVRPVTLAVLVIISFHAFGQADIAKRKRNFNTVNNVALKEFDPVSYFQGKPLKGTSKIEYNHEGIYYYFANEANREEFKKNPDKYEPMYGGWCAYTLATSGERVKIQPTSYKVSGNKLYLFYNFSNDNRMVKWTPGEEKKLKAAADKAWVRTMH